jgi:hypothetical protein
MDSQEELATSVQLGRGVRVESVQIARVTQQLSVLVIQVLIPACARLASRQQQKTRAISVSLVRSKHQLGLIFAIHVL